MVKRYTIRILIIVMTLTLLSVIYVQWMWINNAVDIRKQQFKENMNTNLSYVVNRIEQESYLRLSDEVKEKFIDEGLIEESDLRTNSRNIVDSLIISSGYFQGMDRYSYGYSQGRGYSRITQSKRNVPSSDIFSKFMDSYLKKYNISQAESPERYDAMLKSLTKLIGDIISESATRDITTKEKLKNIPVLAYLNAYLRYQKIDFTYSLIDKSARDSINKSAKRDNVYIVDPFPGNFKASTHFIRVVVKDQRSYLLRSISWLLIGSGLCIIFLCVVFGFTVFIILRQKKLSEVKNDFINNMTHEFKTPIATISLATSAITNPKVIDNKEQIVKFNDMVKKENQRMHRHVEKILQQARLDRREVELRKETLDINVLLNEACEHFMLQCREKGVVLECKPDAKNPELMGDEVHILNCIVNLIDNSMKYSKEDPQILVYSKNVSKGILIGVKDNGVGMSREAQKMVFTRFYRVTNGNIHNVKGFGLGLSYVKSIVTAHNGNIHMRSKLNKGTTIELVFPKK